MSSLAGVEVKFDLFDALKQLMWDNNTVGVDVTHYSHTGIIMTLRNGERKVRREFDLRNLTDACIDILQLEFTQMVKELKCNS